MNDNKIKTVGKWLFILPFLAFGFLHFGPLEFSLPYVPSWLPFKAFWVYFIGACLFAFSVSAIIGKYDKFASLLLATLLLVFVITVHIPKAATGDFVGVIAIFRDVCMAGAALVYATTISKDKRLVG